MIDSALQGPSAVEIAALPKWQERHSARGKSEGQVQVFQRDGKAIAAQWSAASSTWIEVGEVRPCWIGCPVVSVGLAVVICVIVAAMGVLPFFRCSPSLCVYPLFLLVVVFNVVEVVVAAVVVIVVSCLLVLFAVICCQLTKFHARRVHCFHSACCPRALGPSLRIGGGA